MLGADRASQWEMTYSFQSGATEDDAPVQISGQESHVVRLHAWPKAATAVTARQQLKLTSKLETFNAGIASGFSKFGLCWVR